MFKITTLNEYGYRNTRSYESKALAERDFTKLQCNEKVMVTMYENDKPIKYSEKIGLKWFVSVLG